MSIKIWCDIPDPTKADISQLDIAKVSLTNARETDITINISILANAIQFASGCGHKHEVRKFGVLKEKWPQKVPATLSLVLGNISEEAKERKIDVNELDLGHVHVNRASKVFGRIFRAHAYVNAFNHSTCLIQIVVCLKDGFVDVSIDVVTQENK